MHGSAIAKASILRLDKQNRPCESIDVMFNPKELTFSKQNSWKQGANPKTNLPDCEFSGGGPASLKLQLFFDTYADGKDVRRAFTDRIYNLTLVDPSLKDKKNGKGRPPTVRFQWGSTIGFDAVITSLDQHFTLFLPNNGVPVRAILDVTFSQVKDELFYPPQNPTSGGVGGERVWTVREGDTLAWIAFTEYGSPNEWRRIADSNRLTQVRRIPPGTVLVIPNV
ncbi:MAG TPA: hypothetical protein VL475_15925 [Planctomycetaceae bacterium]|jgi:hypothetical protein|nr:hypothetical protein [Planctomycetaceae bacterium]